MGNKIGWILAAVLVLCVGGVFLKLAIFPSASSPTSEITGNPEQLEKRNIRIPLGQATGFDFSDSGDAADDYVKAIAIYDENQSVTEKAYNQLSTRDGR